MAKIPPFFLPTKKLDHKIASHHTNTSDKLTSEQKDSLLTTYHYIYPSIDLEVGTQ